MDAVWCRNIVNMLAQAKANGDQSTRRIEYIKELKGDYISILFRLGMQISRESGRRTKVTTANQSSAKKTLSKTLRV
jgi:hypothetical protein